MSQNGKQNFKDWLDIVLPPSAGKYSNAIDTITGELMSRNLITNNIYSITNDNEIDKIIDKYLSVTELKQKNKTGNNMYSAALKKYKQFLEQLPKEEYDLCVKEDIVDDEINKIEANLDKINVTEKLSVINSRIGQSEFKNGLSKKYKKCILCEITIPELLIASHIKPWSKSNNKERLDLNNGLLLCCLHDKLFDLGFISFDISGKIIISNQINENSYKELKINKEISIKVNQETQKYLIWHKENILK